MGGLGRNTCVYMCILLVQVDIVVVRDQGKAKGESGCRERMDGTCFVRTGMRAEVGYTGQKGNEKREGGEGGG